MSPADRARRMLRDIMADHVCSEAFIESCAEHFQNHYGEEFDEEAEARSARRYRMELNAAAELARRRS